MRKYINKYTIIGLLSCFLLLFVSWGLESGAFKAFFNNMYVVEFDEYYLKVILNFGFTCYMLDGFGVMQLTLPLLAALASCGIMRLCTGYYENAKPRIQRYSKSIARDIVFISLFSALAMFIGFLLFYLFGVVNCPYVVREDHARSFLNIEFGDGFAWKNPYGYYLIEGVYRFFLFPFFYGIFACCSYIFFRKKFSGVIVPVGYFYLLTILCGTMRNSLHGTFSGELVQAIRPDRMTMMGGEVGRGYPMAYPFISLIPPIIASAVFFMLGVRNEKKNG